MFKQVLRSATNTAKYLKTAKLITPAVAEIPEKWDFITAVCLERKPIVTPQLTEMEKYFRATLGEIEYESSFKSNHEIQHEQDIKYLESLKKGVDLDSDAAVKQTAQDFVDSCLEELAKFKAAERVTEPDKRKDQTSIIRKLDKHLVLVVKQKIGEKDVYLLPQGTRREGESLRETAERVLKENCGENVKAQFYYPGPSSFYSYKYPKAIRNDGTVGAKVFIHFARYKQGTLSENGLEFKWLDREELSKLLPERYRDSVLDMLIDE